MVEIDNGNLENVNDELNSYFSTSWIDNIDLSNCPWSQPLVIVTKKDVSPPFRIDFRKRNLITKRQIFPKPCIDKVIGSLSNSCYFTKLDLSSGYWQIQMDPNDMEKLPSH